MLFPLAVVAVYSQDGQALVPDYDLRGRNALSPVSSSRGEVKQFPGLLVLISGGPFRRHTVDSAQGSLNSFPIPVFAAWPDGRNGLVAIVDLQIDERFPRIPQ